MIGSAIRYWNTKPEHKEIMHDVVSDLRAYDKDHITKKDKKRRKIQRDRYLTMEEIKQLKSELKDKHYELKLFLALALSTGARLGAIMQIKAKNINEDGTLMLKDEKNGDQMYAAFLTQEVLTLINVAKLKPDDYIFKLSKVSIQKRLQRILNSLLNFRT
jgi:integrase